MELHAAGLLAVLAAVVFAAQSARGALGAAALAASFVAAVLAFSRLVAPSPTTLGFCVVAAAVAALARPRASGLTTNPPLAPVGTITAFLTVCALTSPSTSVRKSSRRSDQRIPPRATGPSSRT